MLPGRKNVNDEEFDMDDGDVPAHAGRERRSTRRKGNDKG